MSLLKGVPGVLLQKMYGINMVQYNAPNGGCQSVGISRYCNVFTPQLSEPKWPGMKSAVLVILAATSAE